MSLLTKHRPNTWEKFKGQEAAKTVVANAIIGGPQVSAFLFTGPSGVGKTTLARILATSLDADVVEWDAAANNGVESARELKRLAEVSPIGGAHRVIIMDECHMMTKAAWNSLLKAIEEPATGVVWVFLTTEKGKVPKTIQTRCLHAELAPVDDDSMWDILDEVAVVEGLKLTDQELEGVVRSARGSVRRGIALLFEDDTVQEVEEESIALARSLMKGAGPNDLLQIVSKLPAHSAETTRRIIVAYMTKVLLDSFKPSAAAVIDAFADPYPDDDNSNLVISIVRMLNG